MNGLIVLVFLLVLRAEVDCMTKNGKTTCSQLTSVSQNVPQTLLLRNPVEGHNLEICPSNLTCCSKQMENELYTRSSRVLESAVDKQLNATHHFLTTQASLFDDYMKYLLNTGKLKWHELLFKTYKSTYLQHRHIFDEFFSTLLKYYNSGDVDLEQSFNVFFQKIQSKMFTLLDKNGDKKFLNCTSERIHDIKPFGKYQDQITNQLKPSLVYARTFVVALQTGSNITASINRYLSRSECRKGFTNIQHCSVCKGIPDAKVCNATCHNLLLSCFALNPLFDTYWDDFYRGIYELSAGLEGQYDIEAIVGQLGYEISSAIMVFQNNFVQVLNKAQTLCPAGSRKKRAIDKSGSDLYLEGERARRSPDLISLSSVKQRPPSLDTFTTAFQKELTVMKDVWKYLPQKICGGQTFVARGINESCWNGKEMQKNSRKVPNIKVDAGDDVSGQLIVQQLMKLRDVIGNALKNSAKDDDDNEDTGGSVDSGSGSGSASGVESGDGDSITSFVGNVVVTRPSPSTKQLLLITTDESVTSTDDPDDTEGSGRTPYNQYTTNVPSIKITDDEDSDPESGSGNDTKIDLPIYNDDQPTFVVPTNIAKTTGQNKIFGGTIESSDSGSCNNLISYVFVLLVTLVGFMSM